MKNEKSDDESDGKDGSVVGENLRERRKNCRVVNYKAQFCKAMDRFSTALKKSNEAQLELEKRKLAMEKRKINRKSVCAPRIARIEKENGTKTQRKGTGANDLGAVGDGEVQDADRHDEQAQKVTSGVPPLLLLR